jgi:hypothetical protein
VHFPDDAGAVTRFLQQTRDGADVRKIREVMKIVRMSVLAIGVIVKAAVDNGTAGAA